MKFDINRLPLIRKGSSKDIYDAGSIQSGHLAIRFTDFFSIFDRGRAPFPIVGLGAERTAISIRCFDYWHAHGVRSHYVDQLSEDVILVKAAAIPEINQHYSCEGRRLQPVEVLWRIIAIKKFVRRFISGETDTKKCNLQIGDILKDGYRFNPIYVECSTKFESADRYIGDEEVLALTSLTLHQREQLYRFTREAAQVLEKLFAPHLEVRTGKFEIILTSKGQFEMGDSLSPDELEFTGGYDKNILRNFYESKFPEWVEALKLAKTTHKDDKSLWPPYPGAPSSEVQSDLLSSYRKVAKLIGC